MKRWGTPLLVATCSVASLTGCAGAPPAAAPLAPTRDDAPGRGAVLVHFRARDDERWSLRRADGSFVCSLPCSYWVPPSSEMFVRLDGPKGSTLDGTLRLPVPDQLPARPGESLPLTADRTHGLGTAGKIIAGPFAVVFGLMGIGFTGIGIASLAGGGKNTQASVSGSTTAGTVDTGTATTSASGSSTGQPAAVTSLSVGIGALAIAGLFTYWFFHAREGGLELGAAQPARRSAPSAMQLRVTPAGLAGTF